MKHDNASASLRSAAVSRPAAEKVAVLRRLSRIEGQVRGIARMIEDERYCVDILHQIAAIRSALDSMGLQLLEHHTQRCVRQALRSGNGDPAIAELMEVVGKFAR